MIQATTIHLSESAYLAFHLMNAKAWLVESPRRLQDSIDFIFHMEEE